MNKRNKKILVAPIIGKVCQLNAYMIANGKRAYKIIQHNYIDELLKQGYHLFFYARRQLLGKDYLKRVVELCEEIESGAYFIACLGGCTSARSLGIWSAS